jgi:8-oxo-dGTP diphosphatase
MKKGVDYIGVGVGAAIFNEKGEILLALRGAKAKNERGKWEIPGGGVEFNETFEQAIKREIKEELGVEIAVGELLALCSHIILDEKQHWVSPTYMCRITKGKPKIKEAEKCAGLRWVSVKDAEKLALSLITQYDMKQLKKKYPKGVLL